MTERPSSRGGLERNGIDTTIRGLLDIVQSSGETPVPRWRLEGNYEGLLYLIGRTNSEPLPPSHTKPERGRGAMDSALFLLHESGYLRPSIDGYLAHDGLEELIPIPVGCAWHKARQLDAELAQRSQQA